MQFFLEYQKIILRVGGGLFLLTAIAMHFWYKPQAVLSENEAAAANVARMEASVAGKSTTKSQHKDSSSYMQHLKETKKKQLEYLAILLIVLGAGALGYSFVKRD